VQRVRKTDSHRGAALAQPFSFCGIVPAYMETITCYVASGARGNPGPAAIGIVVTEHTGEVVHKHGQAIGNSISNFAEYNAVMVGLQSLVQLYAETTQTLQFDLCLSNEVVKGQLNAEAQITDPGLVPMFIEIHNLRVAHFPHLTFTYIPKVEHGEANRLVNEALDGKR
jgi:hypothetical protein